MITLLLDNQKDIFLNYRIYVDVVFNHMTGDHEANTGTAGSTANFSIFSYPAVPYKMKHFHHPICDINNYDNATEVCLETLFFFLETEKINPVFRHVYVCHKILST